MANKEDLLIFTKENFEEDKYGYSNNFSIEYLNILIDYRIKELMSLF